MIFICVEWVMRNQQPHHISRDFEATAELDLRDLQKDRNNDKWPVWEESSKDGKPHVTTFSSYHLCVSKTPSPIGLPLHKPSSWWEQNENNEIKLIPQSHITTREKERRFMVVTWMLYKCHQLPDALLNFKITPDDLYLMTGHLWAERRLPFLYSKGSVDFSPNDSARDGQRGDGRQVCAMMRVTKWSAAVLSLSGALMPWSLNANWALGLSRRVETYLRATTQ